MSEKQQSEVRKLVDEKTKEYGKILERFSQESIDEYLGVLQDNKKRINSGEKYVKIERQKLSEEAVQILDLMRQYEQDIKQIYMENQVLITHITSVSPENMRGGKISRSMSRDNDCQTESGDWAFASSTPVDGKNLYLARKANDGMVIVYNDTYILGGDNLRVEVDEAGESHVLLNNPNFLRLQLVHWFFAILIC